MLSQESAADLSPEQRLQIIAALLAVGIAHLAELRLVVPDDEPQGILSRSP